jgi:hypothetical protein
VAAWRRQTKKTNKKDLKDRLERYRQINSVFAALLFFPFLTTLVSTSFSRCSCWRLNDGVFPSSSTCGSHHTTLYALPPRSRARRHERWCHRHGSQSGRTNTLLIPNFGHCFANDGLRRRSSGGYIAGCSGATHHSAAHLWSTAGRRVVADA